MATTDPGRAKILTVYKNGDDKFAGKRMVINKRIRTFDSLLQNATVECKATGPVRQLVTPIGGTRIKSLDEIQDQSHLVAVGTGRFKKIQYTEIANAQIRPRPSPRQHIMDIKPVQHSKRYGLLSGKFKKIPTGALTIWVYPNREPEISHRMTFNHAQQSRMDWGRLLEAVTTTLNKDLNGACKYVYKIPSDGDDPNHWEKITDIHQFDNGKSYVAVGHELGGLRRVNYGEKRPNYNTSPKFERRKMTYDSTSTSKNSRRSRASDHSNGTNQSSATNESHNRSYGLGGNKTRNADKSPARNTKKQPRQDEDVFHAKPKQKPVRHTHTPVDYDKDNGGIYKAKGARRETSGAAEVEETQDTKVDLPIDQVEPEEVEEEIPKDSNSREIATTENDLTKQPSEPSDDKENQAGQHDIIIPSGKELTKTASQSEEPRRTDDVLLANDLLLNGNEASKRSEVTKSDEFGDHESLDSTPVPAVYKYRQKKNS